MSAVDSPFVHPETPYTPHGDVVLEVNDLSVTFPTVDGEVRAVRGVSYAVRKGEALGIVGESGSGKSVTSLAIIGLLPKNARVTGSAKIHGQELIGLSDRIEVILVPDDDKDGKKPQVIATLEGPADAVQSLGVSVGRAIDALVQVNPFLTEPPDVKNHPPVVRIVEPPVERRITFSISAADLYCPWVRSETAFPSRLTCPPGTSRLSAASFAATSVIGSFSASSRRGSRLTCSSRTCPWSRLTRPAITTRSRRSRVRWSRAPSSERTSFSRSS